MLLPSSFFSKHFVKVLVKQPYNSNDIATVSKNLCFLLSGGSDFHMIDNLQIAVIAFWTH